MSLLGLDTSSLGVGSCVIGRLVLERGFLCYMVLLGLDNSSLCVGICVIGRLVLERGLCATCRSWGWTTHRSVWDLV